ncbi:MAG: hypothetical protein Kow0020_07290 [Wenzhouxiangellaceae bacterium]
MRLMLILIATTLLAGCPQKREDRLRDETVRRFEAMLRWSQFDTLQDFIHPDWLAEHPISDLDLERLKQFKVSQYRLRQVLEHPDGQGFDRVGELRLYHLHTARERAIEFRERWRWDPDLKRWMLHSGLPDPRMR